ncbi:MAG: DUF4835 family protein [Bacteroidetes bacterium]|nr:DUF4835 family protein [Bacteroidota bacterium]
MFRSIFLPVLVLLMIAGQTRAQEFQVDVSVNVQKLTNDADRQVLGGLEQAIRDYIGQYRYTSDPTFTPDNQIRLTLSFVIETASMNRKFTGQMFVAASRPVFGTGKPTSLIRYTDKLVEFEFYTGYQPQHTEQAFESLSSLLDFYVYLILGLDADSYDPQGGQIYYARAQRIASLSGVTSVIGWLPSTTTSDSRKVLIDEFLDPKYINFRNGFFKFHYDGLDVMQLNPLTGEQGVIDGLSLIAETNKKYPNSIWRRLFFDAKYKEISEFFAASPPEIRQQVYRLLQSADPSHLSEYQNLR